MTAHGEARAWLKANRPLTGGAWCRAHSDLVDTWLTSLLGAATSGYGSAHAGVALIAIGGYGRRELCPESDIDVMLLHERRANGGQLAAIADRLWYPIWDEGYHLGHSVCTVSQALSLADHNVETASALLSSRHLAGDPGLTEQLVADSRQSWERRADRWLRVLAAAVRDRHQRMGEAAFLLEPDLKEARGGLRDVHALAWAQSARAILLDFDQAPLAEGYEALLRVRVELQRRTGRASNILVLQEQDGVAEALGFPAGDHLMASVAAAARRIAWTSDDTWRRVESMLRGPIARTGQRPRPLDRGVVLCDSEVALGAEAVPRDDPTLALRVAVAAARHHSVIDRHALERLAVEAPQPALAEAWTSEATELFVRLLLAGPPAIEVIEALDHSGIWGRIIPEWQSVRSRPQHNPYHRFTVDRHLLETAANAAAFAPRVDRPDLLVLGALFHDLGKGHPGDHSTVGVGLARAIATRMGLPPEDIETLETMVRHHLLLPEVASRRDLNDPVTIERVAEAVGSVARVRLLAALTEADAEATGPSAWSAWKAGLVATLAERVESFLTGIPRDESSSGSGSAPKPSGQGSDTFPSPEQLVWLSRSGRHLDGRGDILSVVTDDRPGIFSRVAGVLALHGLDVMAASAHSNDGGRALAEFRVTDPIRGVVPWPRVVADLELALEGRLALSARLDERRQTYDRPGPVSRRPRVASVLFDNAASAHATVVDVKTVDHIGVLYRVTRALAELDLDIREARVHTLGIDVVDSFYVRDSRAQKVIDPAYLREIERTVLHALDN